MIGIVVSNPKAFQVAAAKAMLRLEAHVTKVFRGYAVTAFQRVVDDTPQWSGNAAASWNFSVGEPDTSVARVITEIPSREASFKVHDRPAIQIAYARNRGKERSVSLTKPVFISNGATSLGGVGYARMLEENPGGYLRPENDGGGMVLKTVDSMQAHFASITPAMARTLEQVKIGGGL